MSKRYKRKRNVFGKRIGRHGVVFLAVIEVIVIIGLAFLFRFQKNMDMQYEIKNEEQYSKMIDDLVKKANSETEEVINIGYLIPNLPTSWNPQECSYDITRLKSMADVSDPANVTQVSPSYTILADDQTKPFEITVPTVKVVRISFVIYTSEIDKLIEFLEYLTNYENERFFYVEELTIDGIGNINSSQPKATFTLYTFYNNVELEQN